MTPSHTPGAGEPSALEILPCAFCGGEPALCGGMPTAPDGEATESFVQCRGKNCGACGPFVDDGPAVAVERWNSVSALRLRLAEANEKLEAIKSEPPTWACPECGPTKRCDEDRCCLGCGADLVQIDTVALTNRLADCELMLRLATSHVGTSWLTRATQQASPDCPERGFWLNVPPDGERFGWLDDDGTGLPILTDEARAKLKGTP